MPPARQLKPKQIDAIKLLATGTPAYQVAAQLQVTTMTLYRWQRLPVFEEKLRTITHSGLEQFAKKTNLAALTAVETLQHYMCDMSVSPSLHVKASLGVLNAMHKVNGALDRGMQHRSADFDVKTRFSGPSFTYDGDGNTCQSNMEKFSNKASSVDLYADEVVV